MSAIISEMWNADENRLQPGDDYELDLQVGQESCKEENIMHVTRNKL